MPQSLRARDHGTHEEKVVAGRGNYRIKLNARVRQMQPIHDMVKWYTRSADIIRLVDIVGSIPHRSRIVIRALHPSAKGVE